MNQSIPEIGPFHMRTRQAEPYRPPHLVGTKDKWWLHILLFVVTLVATTYAGHQLASRFLLYNQEGGIWVAVADGLRYAIPLLLFLTAHEFGHYFAARIHGVSTTLPFYIPSPFIFIPFNIGTFGAVIRIREQVPSSRKLFDIGIAGPLVGFVVAVAVLVYGLSTLPSLTYLFDLPFHEEVKAAIREFGTLPSVASEATEYIGNTALYWILTQFFDNVPPMYEMYHYPVLFAGWLGLFFTALNLMPVGQLDGGHIMYALVGPVWHGRIARTFVLLLLLSASIGFVKDVGIIAGLEYGWWGRLGTWLLLATILSFFMNRIFKRRLLAATTGLTAIMVLVAIAQWIGPTVTQYGYLGWMFWAALLVALIKIDHPPVRYTEPLTPTRKFLGVVSMLIFVLCFSIRPIYLFDPAVHYGTRSGRPVATETVPDTATGIVPVIHQ